MKIHFLSIKNVSVLLLVQIIPPIPGNKQAVYQYIRVHNDKVIIDSNSVHLHGKYSITGISVHY